MTLDNHHDEQEQDRNTISYGDKLNDASTTKNLSMDEVVIGSSFNNNNQMIIEENSNNINDDHQDLVSCSLCNRKFLASRLEKHLVICQKIKDKKRKLFDAAKQRAENLDKINYVPTEISIESPKLHPNAKNVKKINQTKSIESDNSNEITTKNKQSNWRQQHQEFIKTIRAARGLVVREEDDQMNEQQQPMGSLPSGITECPTCNRRFSIKAADRHIIWCAENSKKQKDKQHDTNNNKNQEALERMKARTKYKPISLAGKQQGDSEVSKKTPQSLQRSRSHATLNTATTIATNKADTFSIQPKSKNDLKTTTTKVNNNNNNNRRYKKIISKSSENLSISRTNVANDGGKNGRKTNFKSPSLPRRTTYKNNNTNKNLNTNNTNVKKISTSKIFTSSVDVQNVTCKVDTGINPDRNSSRNRNAEKSAPVMKFKEKFPYHHQSNVKSIIDQFQDIEHILRRNSTAVYDDSPKTVPGVRTRGISPVKNSRNNNNKDSEEGSVISKSETNLQKMDGDIKKRIDQYISRLYDNEMWPNGFMANGLSSQFNNADLSLISNGHHIGAEERRNAQSQMIRQGSANSEEARMSTSDSTDSGLGVVFASNGNNQLLETVNENGKTSADGRKNSAQTFCTDIILPTMSDIESTNRILLRNSSLNDIELLNGENIVDQMMNSVIDNQSLENKPRFCHQCGTKYPNLMAKFCYECGSRRYETIT